MYISQTAAQSIVEEIGREINEHINFMDQEGYIVASTDRARLGTLHTGARLILREPPRQICLLEACSDDKIRRTAEAQVEYLNRLFPGVGDEELDAYMKLIEVFIEEGGSVIRMADRLYMHKNTIQYKLKKMEALNGRDIRKPVGAAVIG